jgi:hypothetical protein
MKLSTTLGAAACVSLLACSTEPEVVRERRTFTAAQMAGCPAHPFKEEFQHIRKQAAGRALELDVRIHDYEGYLVNAFHVSGPAMPPLATIWNFRDADGKPVRSGYYFWAITIPSTGEERVQCTFYVNPADNDKMR